jgi:hypothetical protein
MADDQPPQHHPKPADKLDRSLPVAVGLFHTTSGGRRFAGGFGGQLLARRFATGRFTSGLFRASHREDRLLTNRHGRHDDKREVNHNAAAGIRRTREGKDETGEIWMKEVRPWSEQGSQAPVFICKTSFENLEVMRFLMVRVFWKRRNRNREKKWSRRRKKNFEYLVGSREGELAE